MSCMALGDEVTTRFRPNDAGSACFSCLIDDCANCNFDDVCSQCWPSQRAKHPLYSSSV